MRNKAAEIRARLRDPRPLVMPGVYDALSARIAARAGFEVMFISGYGVSATQLGEPDFGLLTQTEMVAVARRVCATVDCPGLTYHNTVICDYAPGGNISGQKPY